MHGLLAQSGLVSIIIRFWCRCTGPHDFDLQEGSDGEFDV